MSYFITNTPCDVSTILSVCLLFILAMLVKFLSVCMSVTVLVLVDLQCRPKGKTMITQENIDLQLEQEK